LLTAALTGNALTNPGTNTYTPPANIITLRADPTRRRWRGTLG
jgi:hypothetical protein